MTPVVWISIICASAAVAITAIICATVLRCQAQYNKTMRG